jgi:hypothetical protein
MRTHVLAVLAALLLLLVLGAGTAAAGEPTQAVGQDASSDQSASSNANATQVKPSNTNTDVRIFSPGNSGDVTQTNAAGALAIAGNANQTSQSASQDQSGAGTQAAGQDASNHQSADADANATQIAPSNENISVRIKSPGNDGDVTQTNAAAAGAAAGNANGTSQTADQSQGGGDDCKCHGGGGGTQAVGQSAENKQSADADANATQIKPSNSNISVRIGSPGNGGDVTQTNAALGAAVAGNLNDTTQSAGQSQGGSGVQAVGQDASSHQDADADANAVQYKPSNDNTSVRIHSPGNDGDVTQTNLAGALAIAGNANVLEQSADQSQGGGMDPKCGCQHGTPVQAVGQFADSKQSADADATAKQIAPSNSNTPVRIGSGGGSGSVTQTNAAGAAALAGNLNLTGQSTTQSQADGGGVQAVGQDASNKQWADADAEAFQFKPTNTNAPVSIGDGGHGKKHDECGCEDKKDAGGSVTQTNVAGALGIAVNANLLEQSADQSQGGGMDAKCGCHGKGGTQAVGQFADNKQYADADATAKQIAPSNTNAPVNIGSAGGSGSVTQTNAALAGALAANLNLTGQSATQSQGGTGGVQAIGQDASNKQSADADATAFQLKPTNSNTPVSIDDGGHGKKHDECGCEDMKHAGGSGGDVTQTNLAAAAGIALNANLLDQSADQSQGGGMDAKGYGMDPKKGYGMDEKGRGMDDNGYGKDDKCGCYGKGGTQAIGQSASNKQHADADANAFQLWAANDNTPVRIGSRGQSGNVTQTNAALAFALAANLNKTNQEATQQQ